MLSVVLHYCDTAYFILFGVRYPFVSLPDKSKPLSIRCKLFAGNSHFYNGASERESDGAHPRSSSLVRPLNSKFFVIKIPHVLLSSSLSVHGLV